MKLNKIYSEPEGLFETVEFHTGLNFIYGMKEFPEDTLNAIGKSLLLDFIDFALLANYNPNVNSRLKRAYNKSRLKGHFIVLEFEIGENHYRVSRSFDDPYKVYFSTDGLQGKEYKLRELQKYFFTLIFHRDDYPGYSDSNWYRSLIKFFLKIQKYTDQRFNDPVRFTNRKTIELNQYHLFLLGLNNELINKNYEITLKLDALAKAIKSSKEYLFKENGFKNFRSVYDRINYLGNRARNLERDITAYRFESYYDELETEASEITNKIKSLRFFNSSDQNKIEEYKTSLLIDTGPNPERVTSIYNEFSTILGEKVKLHIEEAKQFRKELINSRREFIKNEISTLEFRITKRNNQLQEYEKKLTEIFRQLSDKGALKNFK